MRIWSSCHTFDHPWETVTKAACRKYPNPLNTNVLGTDVIERQVVNGILQSHKLVSSIWFFPSWSRKIIGHSDVDYAVERSEINPDTREMVVKTKNVTYLEHIYVDETLRYTQHPKDPNKTLLKHEAVVVLRKVPSIFNYVEKYMTERIAHNAKKGRKAIEWIIEGNQPEVKDLGATAPLDKPSGDLLSETRRQFDDITNKTKRSMDDLQNVAKKSFDELQNLTVPPSSEMPKL